MYDATLAICSSAYGKREVPGFRVVDREEEGTLFKDS